MVTGGGSGIGRAVARTLIDQGLPVVVADIDEANAQRVADELGAAATPVRLDVTSAAACESVFAEAFAGADEGYLVHSAGIMAARPGREGFTPLLEVSAEAWQRVLDVNLTGTFNVIGAAARALVTRGKRGSVVAITSGGAVRPLIDRGPYSASKAGAGMLVKAYAAELAAVGIRVNAVAPGMTDTPLSAEFIHDDTVPLPPLGRHGTPADIAAAVAFLLDDRASFITGKTIFVDGGVFSG
ncbi:SDR family oxidoreductase [Herbiconiux sp. VKM Ac-1786]|uniref:SDR family NAD(P)-dependent oxidoreductase n=1 Tax=Herbiconiux sp. VKM Ac-1786 TaxID=2783824 RepID=UPI00188DAEC9|nr:SDR family oxidoreductase [Herbiconiux sp. VKM Ac-1786]